MNIGLQRLLWSVLSPMVDSNPNGRCYFAWNTSTLKAVEQIAHYHVILSVPNDFPCCICSALPLEAWHLVKLPGVRHITVWQIAASLTAHKGSFTYQIMGFSLYGFNCLAVNSEWYKSMVHWSLKYSQMQLFQSLLTTFNSSRVKPRPALTFVLYLNVGHRTIGLMAPATGLGATFKAFLALASRRLFLRPGWLNHVLTYLCQSLWKWLLWTILLCFGAMVAV